MATQKMISNRKGNNKVKDLKSKLVECPPLIKSKGTLNKRQKMAFVI